MISSFYSSDDELEDDIEIIFDDSDDNDSFTNDLNALTLTEEKQSDNLKHIKHPLSTELDDYISKKLHMSHRKSNLNNEYMLFPNKDNFILYQLSSLSDTLSDETNDYLSRVMYSDSNVDKYRIDLLNFLASNQWNLELCRKICNDETQRESLGLSNHLEVVSNIAEDTYMCPICCNELINMNDAQILKVQSCDDRDHYACRECYRKYVNILASSTSDSFHIKCIGGSCHMNISYFSIYKILGDTYIDDLIKYSLLESLNNNNNSQFSVCPQVGCENVILTDNIKNNGISPEYVSCLEWHKFCLTCKREVHSPIPCNLLKVWINKLNDGNESLNWVFNNTQPCPSCDVDIEKMEGCNHVKCGVCKFEFCWICHKEWKTHGGSFYDCMHKRDIKHSNTSNGKETISLDRFRNYYKFFLESENNMILDMRIFNKLIESKLNKLSAAFGMNLTELEFLTDCVKEVINARNVIKYSFALLYFMDQSHNLFHIFTHNQMLLLDKIDEVSDILIEANLDSNLANSKTDLKIIKMKPYLIGNTSMLKKLQVTVNKCAFDLVNNKIEIYK
ncbi:hypothetical protein ACO0R3_002388 [Hanseniaspora guilliermondii]